MSDVFYGVSIGSGADPAGVTRGTSTTSLKFELRVEDAVSGNSKFEVLRALEAIKAKIMRDDDLTP